MAKSAIILVASLSLLGLSAYEASPSDSLYSHWMSFKAQYGKQYANQAEEAKRLDLLAKNKIEVDKFNQELSHEAKYTLAVNHLSDKTDDEFKQLLGFKMASEPQLTMQLNEAIKDILEDDKPVPDSIDWRKYGRVSSVKNQGQCGSCWAFATAGVLEGQETKVKKINKSISLSEQNIMDCGTFSGAPCNGGNMLTALGDVASEGGVESEQDYPYLSFSDICKYNKSLAVIANKGGNALPTGDEEALKKTVAKYGPVSVAIEVSEGGDLRHYKSGVYTDKNCHDDTRYLNHGVLIVGYGTDPEGGDYWIVKNSWAATWGDEGYIKMARNRNNMCGIASYPVVATF